MLETIDEIRYKYSPPSKIITILDHTALLTFHTERKHQLYGGYSSHYPIQYVSFSNDGSYIFTCVDRSVYLFNPFRVAPMKKNYECQREQLPYALCLQRYTDGYTHPITSISTDLASQTLIASSHKALVVTDILTQKLYKRFLGHDGTISCTSCFTHPIYLSGSTDTTVRIWDGRSWSNNPIMILNDATDSISTVLINDHEIISSSIDGCLRTYDLRINKIRKHTFHPVSKTSIIDVSYTKDNLCILVSCLDGTMHLIERDNLYDDNNDTEESLIKTYPCHESRTTGNYLIQTSISANDDYIVCGSESSAVFIHDFESGKMVKTLHAGGLKDTCKPVCCVKCHPWNDQIVATGCYNGTALLWGDRETIPYE